MRPHHLGAVLVLLALLPLNLVFAQDPDPADGPVFVARDVEPTIRNGKELKQVLHRVYPSGYRDTGLEVTTILWVYVGSDGSVGSYQVLKSSGYDVFDRAAEQVAKSMLFSPALLNDEPVAVWINQAIHFKSGESGRFLEGPALMAEDKLDDDWVSTLGVDLAPVDRIQRLIAMVQRLVDSGEIDQGQGNALINELNIATAELNDGKTGPAIDKIESFQDQVEGLIKPRETAVLPPEKGQPLIDAAQVILDKL